MLLQTSELHFLPVFRVMRMMRLKRCLKTLWSTVKRRIVTTTTMTKVIIAEITDVKIIAESMGVINNEC